MQREEKVKLMDNVKFYTLEEVKDKHIGKIESPQRTKYEAELQSFLVGEAIKLLLASAK